MGLEAEKKRNRAVMKGDTDPNARVVLNIIKDTTCLNSGNDQDTHWCSRLNFLYRLYQASYVFKYQL